MLLILISHLLRLLYSRLHSPSCPSLPSYIKYSIPLSILVALCWTCFSSSLHLSCWGDQHQHSTPDVSQQCWVEVKDHLPQPGDNPSPASQDAAGLLWCRGALVAIGGQFTVHQNPQVLSAQLLWSWSAPSVYWYAGLFFLRCRSSHFPLLNFMRFLPAHFSSLPRSLWMAAQPSGVSATPSSFLVVVLVSTVFLKRPGDKGEERRLLRRWSGRPRTASLPLTLWNYRWTFGTIEIRADFIIASY